MMERDVSDACSRAVGDETVENSFEETVMDEARGLMGVTGRPWVRYQTNTVVVRLECEFGVVYVPLWPNLDGSEDAPTTANLELVKNVFRVASIFIDNVQGSSN